MNTCVGDTVTLDGIEVYVLAAKSEDGTWSSDVGAEGIEYISVDKNHDLSYYFAGSDYVDESETIDYTSVINPDNKYGYEWGGYLVETGITATSVGSGLSNTNSLIEMNLQPHTDGWYVVWDKIKEFRQSHSDNWFLPSKDELNLIYEAKANLNNLSSYEFGSPHYWSSSEHSTLTRVWVQQFSRDIWYDLLKFIHYARSRLCRYITNSDSPDSYEKKTWVNDELITDVELNRIENRIKELHPFRVRDTVTLDNIDVCILAAKREDGTWSSDPGAVGVEYISVDKNHDLSYYLAGSDYVDYEDEAGFHGEINIANKYGYEWGGWNVEIGIQDTAIGAGLSNTNSLISENLQPERDGWHVVWNKIKEFRETHSDNWFLPSGDELYLIYKAKANLSNLSLNSNASYWSSSEYSSYLALTYDFDMGMLSAVGKDSKFARSRLCRYITSDELPSTYEPHEWVNDELITATELNRIENGIKEFHSTYEPHEWVENEIITDVKLNNIEDQLV